MRVVLAPRLYPGECVSAGALAYAEDCTITPNADGTVTIAPRGDADELITREFLNYVLHLAIAHHLHP